MLAQLGRYLDALAPLARQAAAAQQALRALFATGFFRDVRLEYNGRPAVDGISLRIPAGQTLAIVGPTASGKTALAIRLAKKFNGEVISADSRQVYRGMDIGTGKDLADYNVNGVTIPCHLIDIADAGEHYTLFDYQRDAGG